MTARRRLCIISRGPGSVGPPGSAAVQRTGTYTAVGAGALDGLMVNIYLTYMKHSYFYIIHIYYIHIYKETEVNIYTFYTQSRLGEE